MCQLPARGSTALTAATATARDQGSGSSSRPMAGRRAVVQLRSRVDPSLVVDADELWDAPAVVLARLGEQAETDLLLALRRGGRAWPPLARTLDDARPSVVDLDEDETAQLLGSAAESLAGAGFEVLWPAELTRSTLELRAVVATPAPASVVASGLNLDALCDFHWEATVDGEVLTEAELDALVEAKRPLILVRGRWVVADPLLLDRLRRRTGRVRVADALAGALAGTLTVDGEETPVVVEGALVTLADRLRGLETRAQLPEPSGLDAKLRPYQRRGVAWLAEMADARPRRLPRRRHGPRQDDPAHRAAPAPARDRAPAAVPRWSSARRRCSATGSGSSQRFAPVAPGAPLPRRRPRTSTTSRTDEVVLATLRRRAPRRRRARASRWGLVVADEAQHVKNPLARRRGQLRAIPAGGPRRAHGHPGREPARPSCGRSSTGRRPACSARSRRSAARSRSPVERERDPSATEHARPTGPPVPAAPAQDRSRRSRPSCRRRPRPTTSCPLTAEQATLYEAVVRETLAEIDEARGHRPSRAGAQAAHRAQADLQPPRAVPRPGRGPLAGRSGKLDALDELLEAIIDAGRLDVLVFTQYVAMGRLLEQHLAARGVRVAVPARRHAAGRARGDGRRASRPARSPVFLLSLKAGGTGLNLTRADPRHPLRPLVEPRGRGPGHRPRLPHRPGPAGAGAPARLGGHRRGPHRRAAGHETRAGRGGGRRRRSLDQRAHRRRAHRARRARPRRGGQREPPAVRDHLVGSGVGRHARAAGSTSTRTVSRGRTYARQEPAAS